MGDELQLSPQAVVVASDERDKTSHALQPVLINTLSPHLLDQTDNCDLF